MKNIVLTGMPGAGKSTVGVLLAKALGMDFLDTDILIQKKENNVLQNIIDNGGAENFMRIENQILSELQADNTVIATGGSAVYGIEAMQNLKSGGFVIYLKLSAEVLVPRLLNISTRGIVMKKGQTIQSLLEERNILYEKYADCTIDTDTLSIEDTVAKIIQCWKK